MFLHAGAALLLRAHFDRLHGVAQGSAKLAEFMALLRARRMAVSFEMVTGARAWCALLTASCCRQPAYTSLHEMCHWVLLGVPLGKLGPWLAIGYAWHSG